ncbi:hypothetical protein [Enteractinococcus helveticum]|uniref:Uncharacterized protein n=1 Tax=Enteractinococcus helveticum TaxID=1837282 RepID=A0A1B7LWY0_9MICC|nr:hypothetical protein [Enteractinococcus helveticum]OAV59553.1 hypothetical protein A6F49_17125 [Enteractinococcus helveticum]
MTNDHIITPAQDSWAAANKARIEREKIALEKAQQISEIGAKSSRNELHRMLSITPGAESALKIGQLLDAEQQNNINQ